MQQILFFCFSLHDALANWFAAHLRFIKISILIVAHLSLFGFFFPELRKSFGELAGNLLIGILFISPLAKIFRTRLLIQIVGVRRELGILMGYLAVVHGVGYIIDPAWFQGEILPFYTNWQNGYLFGILAFVLTLPLLFTSNSFAMKHLGGSAWKMVHRVVYAMFIVAILHRFFIKTGSDGQVEIAFFQSVVLLGSYLFLKILAYRNFITPLQSVIAWVASQYGQYKSLKKTAENML